MRLVILILSLSFCATNLLAKTSPTHTRKGTCKEGEIVVGVKTKRRVVCKNIIDVLDAAIQDKKPEELPRWLKRVIQRFGKVSQISPLKPGPRPRQKDRYDWSKAVTKTKEHSYTIDRDLCHNEIPKWTDLSSGVKVVPYYRGGAYRGVKLVGIRPFSFYRAIGLRSGDIVLRVNDKEITNPSSAFDMLDLLQTAKKAHFTVERRGKVIVLHYTMKQTKTFRPNRVR